MTDYICFACPRPTARKRATNVSNFDRFGLGDRVIRTADQRAGKTQKTGVIVKLYPAEQKAYVAWKAYPKLGSFNDTYHSWIRTASLTLISKKDAGKDAVAQP